MPAVPYKCVFFLLYHTVGNVFQKELSGIGMLVDIPDNKVVVEEDGELSWILL